MEIDQGTRLITKVAEGKNFADRLENEEARDKSMALLDNIVQLAIDRRMQLEVLIDVNDALCSALENGDDEQIIRTVDSLKLNNPLPLPVKL
jgi:hypothetical protein